MKNWEQIVELMNDEIREEVHALGIDNEVEFLAAYLERDPEFQKVLDQFEIIEL